MEYLITCGQRYSKAVSFRKLLMFLHGIPFRYQLSMDQNRAEDGKDLRYRFAITTEYEDICDQVLDMLAGPCSVLEMMVALSLRCEEWIMDDPHVGNRTGQWFWGMVVNLGLGSMSDSRFDRQEAITAINRLLDREYSPDGKGGLFLIKGCDRDLRDVEIWHQLCWYLDSIV